jgi:putative hydrolase of the HAD superfamily
MTDFYGLIEQLMPRLNAVTLDLWDTMVQEIPRKNPSLGQLRIKQVHEELEAIGHKYDLEIIQRAYLQSGQFCDDIWNRNRDIPMDDHLLFMLSCIDSKLPSKLKGEKLARVRKVYSETLLEMPPILFSDVKIALQWLAERGYKIGLISNTGRTPGDVLRKILEVMKIADYFDFMTFSNEVFIRKPEKGIFIHTLHGLRTVPRLSIHIGDDPDADFQGAKNAGMSAIHLDREAVSQRSGDTINSLEELKKIL